MSFSSNNSQNVNQSMMRLDYSRAGEYVLPEPPKLNFGQKLMRGLGKAFGFLAPIGAAVASCFGPVGMGVGAGLLGLSNVTSNALQRSMAKDQIAMQAYANSLPKGIDLPGLFETSFDQGQIQADFIAPEAMQPTLSNVVIDRLAAQQESIRQI